MRDITAEELDRPWGTADLESLSQGATYWNPFAVLIMAGNERAEKLGRQWQQLHDGRPPSVADANDPLANLLADAALKRSGIHIVKDDTGEVAAVFPARKGNYSRQEEDDWELRAQAMHEAQGTLDLPDIFSEPTGGGRPTFHGQTSSEPIRFEDWIRTQRGD